MQIKDSVVLITGAAVRVGKAVALYLAERGAHIAFSYYLDDEPWEETLSEIRAKGVEAIAVQTEIRDRDAVQNLVDTTVGQLGRIDVLINSASVWLRAPFLSITENEWDLSLDVNLKGPFLCTQAVAPVMQAQGTGLVINITDLSAFQVWPEYAHHAAGKAGLVALTQVTAAELAPTIRVNAIAPGTVLLPKNAPPEKRAWAEGKSVLKRIGTPEDVARTVGFLMESDFATGAVYFIDGGRQLV